MWIALVAVALSLTTACRQTPSRAAGRIKPILPDGWTVSVSNDVVALTRKSPVYMMGYIARPPQMPGMSKAEFFRQFDSGMAYTIHLRFVAKLSSTEYAGLRKARLESAAALDRGTKSKHEYTRLQQEFERHRPPIYFTDEYSIFVDRPEPRFVEIYPPDAALEIEMVVTNLSKIFTAYELKQPAPHHK